MKVGAEPKKLAFLVGLMVVAGYLYVSGSATDEARPGRSEQTARPTTTQTGTEKTAQSAQRAAAPRRAPVRSARAGQQFRPSLTRGHNEEPPDPMTIDPTLRLELLAKLQKVEAEGITRSIFEFGKQPAPKAKEPAISKEQIEQIRERQRLASEKSANSVPRKAPPPPIKLKFYGFVSPSRTKVKRAFFLDGEDIFVVSEGDLIQKRYKIVKIGVNSAVVEDTTHDNEQTLKIEEQKG